MHVRTILSFAIIVSALSLVVCPDQNAAQQIRDSAIRIVVVVRDTAGSSITIKPTFELTAGSRSTYKGVPIQEGEEWMFQVSVGTYSLVVSAPGYKTERRTVIVTDAMEGARIEVTLEAEKSAREAPGSSILAPKAREEVKKGKEAMSAKRFDEAKSHLEKALQLAPVSSEVNYLYGLLQYYQGNRQSASEYLEKAVSLDRRNGPAFLAIGNLYYQEKDYKHAAEFIEQGLALEPLAWRSEAVLGSSYYQQAAYEKGREHAQKAMEIGKEEASSTGFLLAKCLAALGRKEEAIEALRVFLKSQPPSAMTNSAQDLLKQLQEAR